MTRLERDLSAILRHEVSLVPPTKEQEKMVSFLKMELAIQLVSDRPMESRINGFISLLRRMDGHEDAVLMVLDANSLIGTR